MKIRRSTPDDSAQLARLHRETIETINSKDYPPDVVESWTSRSTEEKFRDGYEKVICFVAEIDDQIVGFGELIKETGNLGAMYVDKNYIGQGIGKQLFVLLEEEAKKREVAKFEFESTTTAKDFYEACGCITIEKTTFTLRSGAVMDAYKMEKDLTA